MLGWLLLGGGLVALALAARIARRSSRGITQGLAMLVAAVGGLLLLRHPGSGLHLPGHGPRRWHQP